MSRRTTLVPNNLWDVKEPKILLEKIGDIRGFIQSWQPAKTATYFVRIYLSFTQMIKNNLSGHHLLWLAQTATSKIIETPWT